MSGVAQGLTQRELSYAEHQLVAAVRGGDDRAFEELYSRYRGRIGSYVFGMVGDHGRAEDVTQEVFISALRRLRATEHPIAFKPWIYEIAKNACIDEFRRTGRTREVPLESSEHPASGRRALVSSAPTPDLAAEGKQRLDDLRGAFGDLSERHHRIIVLRELEGLTYSQIAERMGMSRSGVESNLFRARRRLRQEYEELVSGRRCAQVQTVIDSGPAPALRALRVRERRQFARHLAHCQPCRHHARMAGFDISRLPTPSRAAKLAGLLPFPLPWLGWRRGAGGSGVVPRSGSHPLLAAQALQTGARFTDVASSSAGLWTAALASTVTIAGFGGAFIAGSGLHGARPGAGAGSARASLAGAGYGADGPNAAGSGGVRAAVAKRGGGPVASRAGTARQALHRAGAGGGGSGSPAPRGLGWSATRLSASGTLKPSPGGAAPASSGSAATRGPGSTPGPGGPGKPDPHAGDRQAPSGGAGGTPPGMASGTSPSRPGLPPVSLPPLQIPKVAVPVPPVNVPTLHVTLPTLHVTLPTLHVTLPPLP